MSPPAAEAMPQWEHGWIRWLKRDQLSVWFGLIGLAALAWVDVLRRAAVFSSGAMAHEMAAPRTTSWSLADGTLTAVMWVTMMAAMMLPSAAPMLLLFSAVNRKRGARGSQVAPTGIFLLGYLLVWVGFSFLATGAQWGLHTLMLLSPGLAIANPLLGGLILVAAGAYQFTPLKKACLVHCQSPLDFLFTRWREGAGGALQMGLRHGGYCLGCCWVLMALLFVGGAMNLTWIALIAGLVLLEKVLARGMLVSRIAGSLLLVWGLSLAWRG